MSDEKVVNGGQVFDAEDGEQMNEKIQKDLLADRQAKFDGLPAGTDLVPPTRDSDVNDVEFNDPKLMKPKDVWYTTAGSTDPYEDYAEDMEQAKIDDSELADDVQFNDPKIMNEPKLNDDPRLWSAEDCIENFLHGYPYIGFRWLCRRLGGLSPAETFMRIEPLITSTENCDWAPAEFKQNLIDEIENMKGWTAGVRPPEPPTPGALYQMVWDHFKPELQMRMDESIADLAYRSGSDVHTVVKVMVGVAVACTLREFKHLSFDPGTYEFTWPLPPLELAEAAASCEWVTGAREDAASRKGNPTTDEMAGVTEVNFESVHRPDPQDNIHTKDQILALLADGAPSWMSDETYPFLAGRTDLLSYKDAVLVAAKNIGGLGDEKYAELQSTWSHFGPWDDRNYIALLVWRKKDWQIARELVAKMWNMRDEKAIHDYYDCPGFGFDPEERWEKAAVAIEHDPDLR